MQEIDIIDKNIVDILMEDGRLSSSEISRRLGDVSERVVRYRIDQLLAAGVIRISAVPNPKKLGYTVIADTSVQVESGHVLDVAKSLAEYDCITYVGCAMGEGDVGVQIVARNNEELYAFITEVIGKVPGVIKTTTKIVPLILKDIHQWSIPLAVCAESES